MRMSEVRRRSAGGFTLIELMITIVIVAVLISIGLPAYRDQVMRAARAGAKGEMLEIAVRQKQFLMSDRSYVDKTRLEASGFALDEKVGQKYDYEITLGTGSLPSYTVRFKPKGPQVDDGWIEIDSEGTKSSQYPDKWAR